MATDYKHLQQRGRSEADLLAEDEVPLEREFVTASDTGRTWPGDGISPLSALPVFVLMDSATEQLPDEVRATMAANLADSNTPEGRAVSAAVIGDTDLARLAKLPDGLIVGAIARNGAGVITSAGVVWPDGTPGTFTTDAIDSTGAINSYHITYGSPAVKTFTQPTITRDSSGAATAVPQIVVS